MTRTAQEMRCGSLQKLWAEGGWRRFFKGFTPCLARAVPANGAMLLTVERVTALLNPE